MAKLLPFVGNVMAALELFTIGKIVAPHGVRGDVRIYPDTDFPERFLQMKYGYIAGKRYEITAARFHKHVILMKFAGVQDRNAAEALVNHELQVPREDLIPLKPGRYYIFDLIGIPVYDLQNTYLGILTEVLKTGSNDVYVVRTDNGEEQLFAAIPSVVKEINLDEHKIILNPPEWVDA